MNQVERVYKIDQLLRIQPTPTSTLLERLEISQATFKRDLEYMRSRLHAPIVFDRCMNAYRLDQNSPDFKRYALPGLWFSATEIHALLTLQHLLNNLEPSGLLRPHVHPLSERLNNLLDKQRSASENIRQRVHIIGLGKRRTNSSVFEKIGSALIDRQRLRIRYLARGSGETTERELSPLRLVHYRENWYLDAWCHLRDQLRNFSVDAIQYAEILVTKATDVPAQELDSTFGHGYGIFSGEAVAWAQLRFSPMRARWVSQEQWHPDQKSHFDEQGHYWLEVPYSDHRELVMDILKHGADCEVIGPPQLRLEVSRTIDAMKKNYCE